VLRGVGWFVSPLAIVLGFYTSGCDAFEESLACSSNLSLILASARMVFRLLDVEVTVTFWSKHSASIRFPRTFNWDTPILTTTIISA
jgi:hypothetical protein